ncbi:MAG: hypothetical protein KGH72_00610 [Candidatus Micrarchaeota archaeon]|nr:hypothetical protein [Candidatus Micrarchaeota archaeon]
MTSSVTRRKAAAAISGISLAFTVSAGSGYLASATIETHERALSSLVRKVPEELTAAAMGGNREVALALYHTSGNTLPGNIVDGRIIVPLTQRDIRLLVKNAIDGSVSYSVPVTSSAKRVFDKATDRGFTKLVTERRQNTNEDAGSLSLAALIAFILGAYGTRRTLRSGYTLGGSNEPGSVRSLLNEVYGTHDTGEVRSLLDEIRR